MAKKTPKSTKPAKVKERGPSKSTREQKAAQPKPRKTGRRGK